MAETMMDEKEKDPRTEEGKLRDDIRRLREACETYLGQIHKATIIEMCGDCHCRKCMSLRRILDVIRRFQREHQDDSRRAALAPPAEPHQWIRPDGENFDACSVCGVVRRHDDRNPPCKGVPRITLRAEPTPKVRRFIYTSDAASGKETT